MGKGGKPGNFVLVADIVASRKIVERSAVQEKLRACLRHLNSKPGGGLVSPYTITLGDEFQAVFTTPERLFRDAVTVLIALYPIAVRFSCAIGEITTSINTKQAIGMDGPAFHDARTSVERLKKTKSLFIISSREGGGLVLTNQCLALVSHTIVRWPRSRLEILRGLSENRTVKQIARDLKVTDKAVYKSIDAGAIRTIAPLLDELTDRLRQIREQR